MDNSISGGSFRDVIQAGHVTVRQCVSGEVRAPRVPLMAPAAPGRLVDRLPVRAALDRAADARDERAPAKVVVVTGPPGVGKTGAVLYWSSLRGADFPGGVLYADMSPRGALQPADTRAVLESFVGALGTPRAEMPADEAPLAAYYRHLTAHEPCLVLLDDVVTAAQVAPLLPGHPRSMVVVTSRLLLAGLRGALPSSEPEYVRLAGLDDESCRELFLHSAGITALTQLTDHGRELVRTVVPAFAGLPAAVRIAGARAADPLEGGVEEFARRLLVLPTVQEALTVSDDPHTYSLHQVFEDSYAALDPVAAAVFRRLGLNPTPEFADALVDELAGDPDTGARVRRTLLGGNLLERPAPGRCRMNGLLHEYAGTLARADSGEAGAVAARITDWYLRRAAAAEVLVSSRWRLSHVFREPAYVAGVFRTETEALDALEPDRENAAALTAREFAHGHDDTVCTLTEALRGFFFRRKHHTLWVEVCELGVRAAERLVAADARAGEAAGGGVGGGGGAPDAVLVLARCHYELAFALFDQGGAESVERARRQYGLALRQARAAGHIRTESTALEGLGQVALEQGQPQVALDHFRQALDALGDLPHPRGRALLKYHMGRAASAAHLHEEAAASLLGARHRFAALPEPDRYNEARALTRYAQARLAADRADEAVAPLDEAVTLLQGLGAPKAEGATPSAAPKEEADARLTRGDAFAALGDVRRAREDWQAALDTYRRLGSVGAAGVRERLGGER
ncbi:tetratricopeptide repeat protein [Streptomyces aureoverticillatus]|uniref:tetratricopeptide repeat protein n=1 Tax=Streptomyces aureoverticillatus TaxID=66871 RepID=UPI0013DCDBD2|nr:tetratricopeptide repeat protein [Streptomyces aureoverticillatus]QIB42554.1 tetratricopeptide repeat protein [Streptomyces aureoverticillatus]